MLERKLIAAASLCPFTARGGSEAGVLPGNCRMERTNQWGARKVECGVNTNINTRGGLRNRDGQRRNPGSDPAAGPHREALCRLRSSFELCFCKQWCSGGF